MTRLPVEALGAPEVDAGGAVKSLMSSVSSLGMGVPVVVGETEPKFPSLDPDVGAEVSMLLSMPSVGAAVGTSVGIKIALSPAVGVAVGATLEPIMSTAVGATENSIARDPTLGEGVAGTPRMGLIGAAAGASV